MIGERIRDVRIRLGISQRAACEGICHRSLLSQIENERVAPSLDTLEAICARLRVSISDILRDQEIDEDGRHALEYMNDLMSEDNFDEVVRYGKQALQRRAVRSNPTAYAECLRLVGAAHHGTGEYGQALIAARQAYEASETCRSVTRVVCANTYAAVLIETGEYEESFRILAGAHDLCEVVTTRDQTRIRLLYNLAKAVRTLGHAQEAWKCVRDGLDLCKRAGIVDGLGHLETMKGVLLLDIGDTFRAKPAFERALLVYELLGNRQGVAGSQQNLAECAARSSDHATNSAQSARHLPLE